MSVANIAMDIVFLIHLHISSKTLIRRINQAFNRQIKSPCRTGTRDFVEQNHILPTPPPPTNSLSWD